MPARALRSGILLLALVVLGVLLFWQPWIDTSVEPASEGGGGRAREQPLHAGDEDDGEPAALQGQERVAAGPHDERGPVTVIVCGPHDRVLAGVPVALVEAAPATRLAGALTDDAGVVVFPDVPYDRSHVVAITTKDGEPGLIDPPPSSAERAGIFFNDGDGPAMVTRVENLFDTPLLDTRFPHRAFVEGPRVALRVPVGMPIDVRFEAATNGATLSGVEWIGGPFFVGEEDARQGPGPLLAVEARQWTRVAIRLRPPQGHVLVDRPAFPTWISPAARALTAVVPLRPEARIVLVPPTDVPIGDPTALMGEIRVTGAVGVAPTDLALDGFGHLIVKGLPHLQGESVEAQLAFGGRAFEGAARMGVDAGEPVVVALAKRSTTAPQRDIGAYMAGHHPTVPWHRAPERVEDLTKRLPGSVVRAGGGVVVEVLDEGGTPVPYARLEITPRTEAAWIDLEDGIQRVDPFTNHRGRRTLKRLEPGPVVVTANFGSRRAVSGIEVVRGETQPLRLVLGQDATKALPEED